MKRGARKKGDGWYELFVSVVRNAFLGNPVTFDSQNFILPHTLVRPYDFSRKIPRPSNQFECYLDALPSGFSDAASSEMYRKKHGWIDRGVEEGVIRVFSVGKERYVIPKLQTRTIGIDTSTFNGNGVIGIFALADAEAAHIYLERHLSIPKAIAPVEFKWSKLNSTYRSTIDLKSELLLKMSCEGILVLVTDLLNRPKGSRKNIFSNLFEGCFSGYESTQRELRTRLRESFFKLINRTEVHCDPDFPPVTPSEIVRILVRTLAKQNGFYAPFTPLHANLKSHESKVIQIADILTGCIREKIATHQPLVPLQGLNFDIRKIRSYKGKVARAYYCIESGVGSL